MSARVLWEPCIRMTAPPLLPGTYQPARRTPSRAGKVTSRAPGVPSVAALAMSGWGADVTMPAVPTGRMTHWT